MAQTPLADALRLARFANRRGAPPANELVEMRRESALLGAQAPWTRRRFLKTSGAATLALAGSGLLTSCAKAKGAPRIAVIGAGLAGLNAAYTLKKLGHRAEVYEAAKRMGGRVYTVKDALAPGLVTDIGGEWVNSNHEESISLAEELGLELSDLRSPSESRLMCRTYHFGGVHHTEEQVLESLQPLVERMEEDRDALDTFWRAESEDDRAKAVSLITPFDRISIAEYLENIGATGWLRDLLNVSSTMEMSLDSDQQPAINFISAFVGKPPESRPYFATDNYERYKMVGGFQEMIRVLAERLDEGQVKLAHRLEAVRSSGDGFTLTFQGPNGTALDVDADFVIMTVPFSILRDIEMRMEMPPVKKKVIAELGYGSNSKLMMGVNRRVWREQGYSGYIYSDEPYQGAYDSSRLDGYEGDIGGLNLYFGGQAGIDVGEGTAQEQVERLMPGVEKAFPGVTAVLNGNVERFTWHNYPFAKGSVPCYKVGQWTTIAYSEGTPVGNMLFAGDHCTRSYGYINGAVESGERIAKGLAARLG